MRDNSNPLYFSSNLDTFGGNSGSVVFDADSGLVEGILVRGDQDFVQSTETITTGTGENRKTKTVKCNISNQVGENEGRGEDVIRITNIPELFYEESDVDFIQSIATRNIDQALSLLNQGANINTRNLDDQGKSALHYAVERSDTQLIQLLIDKGIDTEIKKYNSNTALLDASRDNKKEIVEILSKGGANINYRNNSGHNAIRYSIDRADLSEFNQLIKLGARPEYGFINWVFGISDKNYARNAKKQARRSGDKAKVKIMKKIMKEIKKHGERVELF